MNDPLLPTAHIQSTRDASRRPRGAFHSARSKCWAGLARLPLAAALVLLAFPATTQVAAGACDPLCPGPTRDLRALLGRAPDSNVLKLYSSAIDDSRHRLYVAGALTAAIAVYDTAAGSFVGWLDGGVSGELTHKYLFIDEVANDLWIADQTREELRRIDLDDGTLAGPVELGPFFGHAVVDREHRRLIITAGNPISIRAFDGATLEVAWATTALGSGAGAMAIDEGSDTVFAIDLADRDTSRTIHRLRTADGGVLGTLTYSAEQGSRSVLIDHDPATGELWVGNDRSIRVVGPAGGTVRTASVSGVVIEDAVFDVDHGRYLVLVEPAPVAGEVDASETRLWAFDRNTVANVADLPVGRKTHRMVLSNAADLVYATNGDSSTVWQVSTSSFGAAVPIRLGESLEGIVPAADGLVYTSSRLGGSELHVVDPLAGTASVLLSGTWPYPVLGNRAGDELYVLDFWDGTLSVFDLLPTRTLRARIALGLPRGTTDRLPDLVVDETRQLAFAALPEHGKVAVVDLESEGALGALTVPDFAGGASGGGPGDLQLAVAEQAGVLWVLAADHRRLHRFDLDAGRAFVGTTNLSGLDWSWAGKVADRNSLFVDEARGVVWVGPHELDLDSALPTGRRLTGHRQVLGTRGADAWWAYGLDEPSGHYRAEPVAVSTLTPTGPGLDFGIPATLVFVPYLDPRTGTLWIGDQTKVELTAYTTEEDTNGGTPCVATATAMCLADGRFRVSATFAAPGTSPASAHTVALTADTGYLWFFAADNVELVLKVLDGRGVNGAFWVFIGPLSDVHWTVEVEDSVTGAVRRYENAQGAVTVVTDTSAFPSS